MSFADICALLLVLFGFGGLILKLIEVARQK